MWNLMASKRLKGKIVKFKNFVRKIKPPFITYADFENTLVPEDNGNQNPDVPYANNFQNHNFCSYGYKLVSLDDQFRKSFKSYLGEDSNYKFIIKIVKENKCQKDVMKNILIKDLWWIKKMIQILKVLLNIRFVIILMLMVMSK